VTAFRGPNGGGKTTTLRVLLGLAAPTSGRAAILGRPYAELDAPATRVGAVLESTGFHPGRRGRDHLRVLAAMAGVDHPRVDEALDEVGLGAAGRQRLRAYSLGMRQRLGLAGALLGRPEVLILDEPTNGLDPQGMAAMRDLISALGTGERTVLLSSHLLGEVEQVCDRVAILHRGDLIQEGDIATLTRQTGLFVIGLAPGQELPVDEVRRLGYQVHREAARAGDFWEVGLKDGQSIDPVIDLVHARGLKLRHLVEKRMSLEDLFLATVEESEPGVDAPAKKRERPAKARRRYDD
jgi:ABC-2 type transport system ATP-binding protein